MERVCRTLRGMGGVAYSRIVVGNKRRWIKRKRWTCFAAASGFPRGCGRIENARREKPGRRVAQLDAYLEIPRRHGAGDGATELDQRMKFLGGKLLGERRW